MIDLRAMRLLEKICRKTLSQVGVSVEGVQMCLEVLGEIRCGAGYSVATAGVGLGRCVFRVGRVARVYE